MRLWDLSRKKWEEEIVKSLFRRDFENLKAHAELLRTEYGRAGCRLISSPLYGILAVVTSGPEVLETSAVCMLGLDSSCLHGHCQHQQGYGSVLKNPEESRCWWGWGGCWRRWWGWAEKYTEHEHLLKTRQTSQPTSNSGKLHFLQFGGNESTHKLNMLLRFLITVLKLQSKALAAAVSEYAFKMLQRLLECSRECVWDGGHGWPLPAWPCVASRVVIADVVFL